MSEICIRPGKATTNWSYTAWRFRLPDCLVCDSFVCWHIKASPRGVWRKLLTYYRECGCVEDEEMVTL